MKKILLFCCLLCLFALVSCNSSTPPHTHTYTPTVVPPSCEEEGYTVYICSGCGDQYVDQTVAALGHDYLELGIEDAACNQYQIKRLECSICHQAHEQTLTIKGTIHSYISVVTYPDNVNGGYTTHTCKNCFDSYVDSYTDPVDFSVGLAYTKKALGYYVSGIGTCTDADVIIPAVSEQGYPVIGILEYAFANTNVRSITVSDGVDKILEGAFAYCKTLEAVTLGPNAFLTSYIFANNPALTSLTMSMQKPLAYYFAYSPSPPDGFKGLVQGDGSVTGTYYGAVPLSLREVNLLNSPCDFVLSGCDMLSKITIPADASYIGISAFNNCTGLTEFQIPESVKSIGRYAFSYTSLSSIVIPDSVVITQNDYNIFQFCTELSDVTLPKGLTCIPSGMFSNCTKLTHLDIPEGVTSLGSSVFYLASIETIRLPNGIISIGSHAFSNCTNLKEIVLPQNLQTIEYGTFNNCIALAEITLPLSLQEIEFDAFQGCSSLEEIIIPDSVKTIGHSVFKNCTSLKHVKLPAELDLIASSLFSGCSSLRELSLPNTVTTIDTSAFEESGLLSLSIPASVTVVRGYTFAGCRSLTSVVFEGENTSLASYMFKDATALESLCIPKNVTQIPQGFCYGATSLRSVTFPSGLQIVDLKAFFGCSSLESVTFPATLISIRDQAFKGCSSLVSIDYGGACLTQGACRLANEWFADCTSLTEIKNDGGIPYISPTMYTNTPLERIENHATITYGWLVSVSRTDAPSVYIIPDGVTKIFDYAFRGCTTISEIIIPEGVIFLGTRVFGESEAKSITKITFPDTLTDLAEDTIYFLENLKEVSFGKYMENLPDRFFNKLEIIHFRGTIEEFKAMPWYNPSKLQKITVICTDGTIAPSAL